MAGSVAWPMQDSGPHSYVFPDGNLAQENLRIQLSSPQVQAGLSTYEPGWSLGVRYHEPESRNAGTPAASKQYEQRPTCSSKSPKNPGTSRSFCTSHDHLRVQVLLSRSGQLVIVTLPWLCYRSAPAWTRRTISHLLPDCLLVLPNSFQEASSNFCCKTLSLGSPAKIPRLLTRKPTITLYYNPTMALTRTLCYNPTIPILSIVIPFLDLTNSILRILKGNPKKELQRRL